MSPAWLKTFYDRWNAARGEQLTPGKIAFRYDWNQLLDEASLLRVEDRRAAERNLLKLCQTTSASPARLQNQAHKYRRYIIEKIILPVASEPWLMETFGHIPAVQLQAEALQIVEAFKGCPHPLYPELWTSWCLQIEAAFQQGRNLHPLFWKRPSEVRELLQLTHAFTSKTWQDGTRIREASMALVQDSKALEDRLTLLESCLSSLFERPSTLESFGIVLSESEVKFVGDLTLHYADGSSRLIHKLKGITTVSLSPDLEEAVRASTSATRLLTVENSKTTLPALAAKNTDGSTLLAACSFPSKALVRLLQLLPPDLPVHHFGDTDPTGFLILSKLRQQTAQSVRPFLMQRQASGPPVPLSERDLALLPGLLADPLLADVRDELQRISDTRDKSGFEQEGLGRPDLDGWPFYRSAEGC
ncbi:hypothetical protein SAMN02745166_00550 [Prosthecobacter debontii]|uniref:Wadjet protein JetD C-terminal domain-containing protein n=1 Tax=Prosthecobacter debontii TaxID=48467 RepID=A0A1T4WR80_9BACT|nr:Wadjet anti-phage system protein JetD domain-containing protein [Prosthecobacter debontii]SKA79853.1 hypothetical protein SAMN02745166_00550 [Prosthecobacter debontii]